MVKFISKHIPKYMDDRTTLVVMLSDDLKYRYYEQVLPKDLSSWYDSEQDRAFTTTSIDDVPMRCRQNLILHIGGTSKAQTMYPVYPPQIKQASASKQIAFKQFPQYVGDQFQVFWDVGKDDNAVSAYDASSSVASFCHEYAEYGEHRIKFSSNVTDFALWMQYDPTIEEYTSDRITRIESRSPAIQSMQYASFSGNLQSISMHCLSAITTQWYDCYELTSIELPDLEDIAKTYSVNCMRNLERFYAPKLKRISKATGVFKGDVALREVYFPELTAIYGGNGYTFMTNVSLSSAYMPKLKSCLGSEFAYCVNLKETDFSSLTAVTSRMFADCLCLKKLAFPKAKSIGEEAFYRCQNLKTIDLSKLDEVPTLANTNAFSGILVDYEVLVKQSMLDAFQTAPNWSLIADHLKPTT